MPQITPNLWFDKNGEEAAEFYCSIFPNSQITAVSRYPKDSPGEEGAGMTVDVGLDGTRFTAINGGSQFQFDEAISFLIECKDQEEVDYYWEKLTDGGKEVQCGWLTDRFGVSWQVIPGSMDEFIRSHDEAANYRAFQAMLKMVKIDIAELERAARG